MRIKINILLISLLLQGTTCSLLSLDEVEDKRVPGYDEHLIAERSFNNEGDDTKANSIQVEDETSLSSRLLQERGRNADYDAPGYIRYTDSQISGRDGVQDVDPIRNSESRNRQGPTGDTRSNRVGARDKSKASYYQAPMNGGYYQAPMDGGYYQTTSNSGYEYGYETRGTGKGKGGYNYNT